MGAGMNLIILGKQFIRIKSTLIVMGIVSLMALWDNPYSGVITSYASEQVQSPRWEGTGDIWKLKSDSGNGYLTNSWFQDLDSSWYMLGSDGIMYAGLVTDQSTGKTYLLNTNHDGTYGRMLTIDGAYEVNGVNVYLTFDQNHNGSYGAITGGLNEVRNTGVKETGLASIPTDSGEGTVIEVTKVTTGASVAADSGNTEQEYKGVFNPEDYAGQDGGGYTGKVQGERWY